MNGNQTEYRLPTSRAKPLMCSSDVQFAKHSRDVHASKFSINWPQRAFSFSPPSLGLEHDTPYRLWEQAVDCQAQESFNLNACGTVSCKSSVVAEEGLSWGATAPSLSSEIQHGFANDHW